MTVAERGNAVQAGRGSRAEIERDPHEHAQSCGVDLLSGAGFRM